MWGGAGCVNGLRVGRSAGVTVVCVAAMSSCKVDQVTM